MKKVAIIANGPTDVLPDLTNFKHEMDIWISADKSAIYLIDSGIQVDYAVGDFDSASPAEKEWIHRYAGEFIEYPTEKDETDLEIAVKKAMELKPSTIYLFGVTGGRLDHSLVNIHLLVSLLQQNQKGIIIDKYNQIEAVLPGSYTIEANKEFPNISFVPLSRKIIGLTLKGFYYPLINKTVPMGSTLCVSNKLISNYGTFSFEEGILLLIKSRDI